MIYTIIWATTLLMTFHLFSDKKPSVSTSIIILLGSVVYTQMFESENRQIPAGLLAFLSGYVMVGILWLKTRINILKLFGFIFFLMMLSAVNETIFSMLGILTFGSATMIENMSVTEIFVYLPMLIWIPLLKKPLKKYFSIINLDQKIRLDYIFSLLSVLLFKALAINRVMYLAEVSPLTRIDHFMIVIILIIDIPLLLLLIYKFITFKSDTLTSVEKRFISEANNNLLNDIRKSHHDLNNVFMIYQNFSGDTQESETILTALLKVKYRELELEKITVKYEEDEAVDYQNNLSVCIALGILIDNAKEYLIKNVTLEKKIVIKILKNKISVFNLFVHDNSIDLDKIYEVNYSSKSNTRGFGLSNAKSLLEEMDANVSHCVQNNQIEFKIEWII